jgi:hypothetical protein
VALGKLSSKGSAAVGYLIAVILASRRELPLLFSAALFFHLRVAESQPS